MADSRRDSEWSPSDLTAVPTPTLSRSPTLALDIDINNPADLEAQLLRLKERRDSANTTSSTSSSSSDTPSKPKPKTLSTYLTTTLSPSSKYLQTQFLFLSFATGIIDACTFSLYSVFVTKQTGNTIFLALSALKHTSVSQNEANVAISISTFFISAVLFGHLGAAVGKQTRLWMFTSNCISTALVFAATASRYWCKQEATGSIALIIIALLSIAMGAQVTLAFAIKVPDINTTMVTGAIIQIATDANIFNRDNSARSRRSVFFLAMLGGAFVGAGCASRGDAVVGLLVAACLKLVVTLMGVV
ncbi:hypothetical protein AUEXF2481DRAFT_43392 [Aureobasidium subglaciale EXF-2481]|uniref:DUF1275 domain protein n=1 Tax=Aureobasidium subglaciale (strain EXF-2481) TaxID=1043005 RepID=A0A074Y2P0_AURSE|nr:uncharacterized protein AUEXF2481DRAFT_43392 [Aureobasidium subglaciale EXF-2481]KEQ91995.1 hypothetical protein AUEXF2481DRAFT_43392 [Aureobasidium subglaciale EXF-2481]